VTVVHWNQLARDTERAVVSAVMIFRFSYSAVMIFRFSYRRGIV